MTHPSDRLWEALGKTRPPDMPRDLMPGDCRACYDTIGPHGKPQGISRPEEQCLEHRGGRIA